MLIREATYSETFLKIKVLRSCLYSLQNFRGSGNYGQDCIISVTIEKTKHSGSVQMLADGSAVLMKKWCLCSYPWWVCSIGITSPTSPAQSLPSPLPKPMIK